MANVFSKTKQYVRLELNGLSLSKIDAKFNAKYARSTLIST